MLNESALPGAVQGGQDQRQYEGSEDNVGNQDGKINRSDPALSGKAGRAGHSMINNIRY